MNWLGQRAISIAAGLLCAGLAGGCAYYHALDRAETAYARGKYDKGAEILKAATPPARDRMLHLLELGSCYHAAGRFAESNGPFLAASALAREYDDRARISLRDAASFAASLAVNDNLLSYRAEPYERVLLHTHLALNYLMLRDLENARVEILQGYQAQREMRERNETEIARSESEAARRKWDVSQIASAVRKSSRAGLRSAANVYQNAFTYYLSSIVYEMTGETSDAYIDAKTVYALSPDFRPAQRALMRYAAQLGAYDDLALWRSQFRGDPGAAPPNGSGDVVVLYERGLAPVKSEVRLTLPVPIENHLHYLIISFPVFSSRENPVATARLREGDSVLCDTSPLMSVEATALRNLWDRAPAIAIRQLVRASGKVVLQEQARKEYGPLAELATLLFSDITEQADIRSWRNLPAEYQAARLSVPAGAHDFTLDLISPSGAVLCSVPVAGARVPEGGMAFILLRSTGVHGTASQVCYERMNRE